MAGDSSVQEQRATASAGIAAIALPMAIYAVAMMDRQVVGIVLPQIRSEFHFSDTMLGLLTGPAFAVFYTVLGIPAALLCDRGYRRGVIAASLGIFSLMTLLCGTATSYLQLALARCGVGIGEAGTGPALQSYLAERHVAGRRMAALSLYSAGGNIGLLLAFFGGGLIAQTWGWRAAMMAAGALGLVLIPALGLLQRGQAATPAPKTSLMQTAKHLWRQPGFRLVALACGVASISGYAALAFAPSYLVRSHHLTPAQTGLALALAAGVFGFAGTSLPGLIASRFPKINGLKIAAITLLLYFPGQLVFYLSEGLVLTLAGMAWGAFFASAFMGPAFAAVQDMALPGMRAQAAALLLLVLNLVGMGLGPQIVGIVSDLLRETWGEESLRYAMMTAPASTITAACCFLWASRYTARTVPDAA